MLQVVYSFYELFRIPLPETAEPTNIIVTIENTQKNSDPKLNRRAAVRQNLVDNYVAATLVAFLHSGLIEALVHLGTQMAGDKECSELMIGNVTFSVAVNVLLGEVLKLANRHVLEFD